MEIRHRCISYLVEQIKWGFLDSVKTQRYRISKLGVFSTNDVYFHSKSNLCLSYDNLSWYVWGRLWVSGWGGGESATSHTRSNLHNKCAERKEGKAKGLKKGEVASEQAGSRAAGFRVGLYSREVTTQNEDFTKFPPGSALPSLAASLLVQNSLRCLPCKKACWQSREQVIEFFFRTKIKFLSSLGPVRITNLANDIQRCTGKHIYHADLCLPISHCAQMVQQKVSSSIERTHKIFQVPGK